MEATDGDDRISSLPDEVLLHILSFLPMKPSVQTSILSSRWRDMWKSNPVFDFSDLPFYSPDDPEEAPDYSFVSRCLELYRASKLKRFAIRKDAYDYFWEFEKWVAMAAAKHVEELQVTFFSCFESMNMFPALYAAKTVKNLHLSGFIFGSSSGFNNLVLLKDLCIVSSSLCDEVVEAIVSSCPLLENLTLQACLGLSKVKIAGPSLRLKQLVFVDNNDGHFTPLNGLELEAPNLVFFKYAGSIVPFRLNHLHCLSQVDLFFDESEWNLDGPMNALNLDGPTNALMDDTRIGHVKTTMDKLSHVKILRVTTWFVQFIAKAYDTVGNRCLAFQNLKTFFWSGMLKTKEELFSLVAFLGDCPSLEFLTIKFIDCRPLAMLLKDEEPCFVLEGEEPKIRVGCLYQLRKIELHRCKGHLCEIELIKLLFEKAVVLDTLSIIFAKCASELLIEELIEQVPLYPRGSSQAQVKFYKEKST